MLGILINWFVVYLITSVSYCIHCHFQRLLQWQSKLLITFHIFQALTFVRFCFDEKSVS